MADKQTVKVGDRVKSLVTQLDVREEATYEVKTVDFDGAIWVTDDVGDRFYLTTDEFVLWPVADATGKPAFKVGDRVRLKHANLTGTIKKIPGDGLRNEPSYAVNWDWYPDGDLTATTYESEIELASLTIETGKFYCTRDGRKVGPMRRYNGGWMYEADNHGRMWRDDGIRYYEESRGGGSDLIAEWVDEPAGNDNRPATQPAIVALIENGQPKPSEKPKVHKSEESATDEAERLAVKYPGQKFGVFVLADSRIADVVIRRAA